MTSPSRPRSKHSPDVLRACLSSYASAISKKAATKKAGVGRELLRLDTWVQEELPARVAARDAPHITRQELSDVMKWKLSRGKFRPRLQQFADANEDALVVQSSTASFAKADAGDLAGAINDLCVLKGVGPATASAILACHAPEKAAFMADESVAAILNVAKIDYTLNVYLQYAKAVGELVTSWNAEASDKDFRWTARAVGNALWAKSVLGEDVTRVTGKRASTTCDGTNGTKKTKLSRA